MNVTDIFFLCSEMWADYFLTLPIVHGLDAFCSFKFEAEGVGEGVESVSTVMSGGIFSVRFSGPISVEDAKKFCPQAEWSPDG